MKPKQYAKVIVAVLCSFVLGFLIIARGIQLHEEENQVGVFFIVSGVVCLIAAIVYLIMNYKSLLRYEIEQKWKKNEQLELRTLQPISMDVQEAAFPKIFVKFRHGKVSQGLYWVHKPNVWIGNATFVIQFKDNDDMTPSVESEDAQAEETEESDFTEQEWNELNRQLPKSANNRFQARVVFNCLDSIDETKINQARRIVTNAEILSRSLGMFSPILIYFLYDKNTKTLYYEPYRPYKLYPRPRMHKLFLKMLGMDPKKS
jgi:hypothetical protein